MIRWQIIRTKRTGRKNRTGSIPAQNFTFLGIMAVLALFLFILTFEKPAEFVANLFGWEKEEVLIFSRNCMVAFTGLTLVLVGLVFATIPVVGVALAVLGAALLLTGVVNLYNFLEPKGERSKGKINGSKL